MLKEKEKKLKIYASTPSMFENVKDILYESFTYIYDN